MKRGEKGGKGGNRQSSTPTSPVSLSAGLVNQEGGLYYYHLDHLGTPQIMTDDNGDVVWSADYKPFGETDITINTLDNNFRFPGQYYDEETGLHYNYFRYYEPGIGRYLRGDPVQSIFFQKNRPYFIIPLLITNPSKLTPYLYAINNPVKRIDPTGLDSPGCDAIPDILETRCRRRCCDIHDECFAKNKCTAEESWPKWCDGGKTPCSQCNQEVWDCFTDCAMKDTVGDGGPPTLIEFTWE